MNSNDKSMLGDESMFVSGDWSIWLEMFTVCWKSVSSIFIFAAESIGEGADNMSIDDPRNELDAWDHKPNIGQGPDPCSCPQCPRFAKRYFKSFESPKKKGGDNRRLVHFPILYPRPRIEVLRANRSTIALLDSNRLSRCLVGPRI